MVDNFISLDARILRMYRVRTYYRRYFSCVNTAMKRLDCFFFFLLYTLYIGPTANPLIFAVLGTN